MKVRREMEQRRKVEHAPMYPNQARAFIKESSSKLVSDRPCNTTSVTGYHGVVLCTRK